MSQAGPHTQFRDRGRGAISIRLVYPVQDTATGMWGFSATSDGFVVDEDDATGMLGIVEGTGGRTLIRAPGNRILERT